MESIAAAPGTALAPFHALGQQLHPPPSRRRTHSLHTEYLVRRVEPSVLVEA